MSDEMRFQRSDRGLVYPLGTKTPVIPDSVFVAPGAILCGDMECGDDCSFWYGVVARADVGRIRIGERVNIQDHTLLHMTGGKSETIIGDDVTIGHRAIVHGATIGNCCLIGMGATVMDNAVVGEESIIGAGALVTPGTVIPPRSLAVGSPARVRRELTDDDVEALHLSAEHYVAIANMHRKALEEAARGK